MIDRPLKAHLIFRVWWKSTHNTHTCKNEKPVRLFAHTPHSFVLELNKIVYSLHRIAILYCFFFKLYATRQNPNWVLPKSVEFLTISPAANELITYWSLHFFWMRGKKCIRPLFSHTEDSCWIGSKVKYTKAFDKYTDYPKKFANVGYKLWTVLCVYYHIYFFS